MEQLITNFLAVVGLLVLWYAATRAVRGKPKHPLVADGMEADEIMDATGIADLIDAHVPDRDARKELKSRVRITIDSICNTSDVWKQLYEREKERNQ